MGPSGPFAAASQGRIDLGRAHLRSEARREILANWWYFWWYGSPPEGLALAVSYSESGADGRIRTGDPLFTNQDLRRPERIKEC